MNSSDNNSYAVDPLVRQHSLTYPKPMDQLALALCESASRTLRIVSPRLDHQIFDSAEMADAISALARRDSQSRVQILISDSQPMIQNGHRLLNLARRIPSSIIIKKLADHPEMTGETLVIRDLSGLLVMPADEGPGFYEPDSRAAAQPYIDRFEPLWQRAVRDQEFRRLGL